MKKTKRKVKCSEKPKTGIWKEEYAGNGWNDFWDFTCSECGKEFRKFYKSNFCPNCGARMRGTDNEYDK